MVLSIFSLQVLLILVLGAWSRLGLPLLSNLAGLFQHSKAALLDAWHNKVAADRCRREGFRWRGGPCWMSMALCSSLILLMFGIEIRVFFGVLWLVECGMAIC